MAVGAKGAAATKMTAVTKAAVAARVARTKAAVAGELLATKEATTAVSRAVNRAVKEATAQDNLAAGTMQTTLKPNLARAEAAHLVAAWAGVSQAAAASKAVPSATWRVVQADRPGPVPPVVMATQAVPLWLPADPAAGAIPTGRALRSGRVHTAAPRSCHHPKKRSSNEALQRAMPRSDRVNRKCQRWANRAGQPGSRPSSGQTDASSVLTLRTPRHSKRPAC